MKEIYLEKRWGIFWYTSVPLVIFVGWLCLSITRSAMTTQNQIIDLNSPLLGAILADVLLAIGLSSFLAIMLFELFTTFNDDGISKLGFRGYTFIYWKEVLNVTEHQAFNQLQVIDVYTSNKNIRINALYYKNPQALISVIRSQVESNQLMQKFM